MAISADFFVAMDKSLPIRSCLGSFTPCSVLSGISTPSGLRGDALGRDHPANAGLLRTDWVSMGVFDTADTGAPGGRRSHAIGLGRAHFSLGVIEQRGPG